MSALALANNPVFHARTKHVEVDYHFVREKIQNKALCIAYIPSAEQLADIFTKPLNSPHFLNLKAQLPMTILAARCLPSGHHLEGGCEDDLQHQAIQENSAAGLGELTVKSASAHTTELGGSTIGTKGPEHSLMIAESQGNLRSSPSTSYGTTQQQHQLGLNAQSAAAVAQCEAADVGTRGFSCKEMELVLHEC